MAIGRRLDLTLALAGLGLFLVVPPFLPQWITFLLTLAWAKALAVLGIVLLLRGGLLTFGHALYYAVGAYTAGFAVKFLGVHRSEEHTSELQSLAYLVCRLLLEKKKNY